MPREKGEVFLKGSLHPIIIEGYKDAFRTLRAYTQTYLREEILDEALVRNVEAFRLEPYLKSARRRLVQHPKY